jgi:hypothetical protein
MLCVSSLPVQLVSKGRGAAKRDVIELVQTAAALRIWEAERETLSKGGTAVHTLSDTLSAHDRLQLERKHACTAHCCYKVALDYTHTLH